MNRRNIFKTLLGALVTPKAVGALPAQTPVWNATLQRTLPAAKVPKYGYIIRHKRFPSK